MTIAFYDAHMRTLTKLNEIAEKHGMRIRFGTRSDFTCEADATLLNDFIENDTPDCLNEYYHEIIDGKIMMTENRMWFELYEPRPTEKSGKYHVMTYVQSSVGFRLQDDWEESLENVKDDFDEDDEEENINNINKLINFINDSMGDGWQGIDFSDSPTIINGFGNETKVVDYRVYREGMALKFFGDLVCDYLEEPRIVESY